MSYFPEDREVCLKDGAVLIHRLILFFIPNYRQSEVPASIVILFPV